MKFEGRFMIGNNQAGKGDKVSYRWSGKILNKISDGIGRIFPKKPKIICEKCKKVVKNYKVTYNNDGTTTTVCKDCCKKKFSKCTVSMF